MTESPQGLFVSLWQEIFWGKEEEKIEKEKL